MPTTIHNKLLLSRPWYKLSFTYYERHTLYTLLYVECQVRVVYIVFDLTHTTYRKGYTKSLKTSKG